MRLFMNIFFCYFQTITYCSIKKNCLHLHCACKCHSDTNETAMSVVRMRMRVHIQNREISNCSRLILAPCNGGSHDMTGSRKQAAGGVADPESSGRPQRQAMLFFYLWRLRRQCSLSQSDARGRHDAARRRRPQCNRDRIGPSSSAAHSAFLPRGDFN